MAQAFYKHIVVVHGIGEEQLNETGVNFMNELCRSLPDESGTLSVVNLVSRDTPLLVKGHSVPAYVVFTTTGGDSYYIGFSEVYWQPITKGYLATHQKRLPVPTFTWAHSINSRIRGVDRAGQSLSGWREAIDNAETLLGLLNQLAVISKKTKLFSRIMRDFLGDVQMYAEVDPIHNDVNGVFGDALDDIAVTRQKIGVPFDSAEIYIVAHSEGTVVSWKSLMLARSAEAPPAWLDEIKGLVTLGSPIDKHHLVWGEQNFPANMAPPQATKIRWWNFWDYSDPVGHSLDGIFPAPGAAENNQFERVFDAGFARYPIPGVAHVDYWRDVNIYHRIIQEVMQIPAGFAPWQMETGSRWWGHWWLMSLAARVAYGLGRAVEAVAVVYFLSRLIAPVRSELLEMLPWIKSLLALAKDWPFATRTVPGLRWVDMAIWVLGPAAVWKVVWDGLLGGFQDRILNLESQFRVERVAMTIWSAVLLFAALNIQIAPDTTVKDYVGWAIGLLVTILIWKVHTAVSKGLVQLWRYGKGCTAFKDRSQLASQQLVQTQEQSPIGEPQPGDSSGPSAA
jgi:hypothetical protein